MGLNFLAHGYNSYKRVILNIGYMRHSGRRRLLLIGNTLETFGGGERWLLEVATILKQEYYVTILNPISVKSLMKVSKAQLARSYDLKSVDIVDLPSFGIESQAFGTERFTLMVPKFRALAMLKDAIANTDVVYCLSSNPLLLGSVVQFCSIYRKKLVFGVHNPAFYKLFERNGSVKQALMNKSYKVLLRRISYFHVINKDDEKLIRSRYPHAKVFRIPNFISKEKENIRNNRKQFIVLFIGRFQMHQKGIDLLSRVIPEVVKRESKIMFHLIGSGGDGEGVIKTLAANYKNNVKWLGFVDTKTLTREYRNAGLLILTSRFEGFPLVVLEAQSFGLPVVAFDVKGPGGIMINSYQGDLISQFKVEEFAKSILKFHASWKKSGAAYIARKQAIADFVHAAFFSTKVIPQITRMLKI